MSSLPPKSSLIQHHLFFNSENPLSKRLFVEKNETVERLFSHINARHLQKFKYEFDVDSKERSAFYLSKLTALIARASDAPFGDANPSSVFFILIELGLLSNDSEPSKLIVTEEEDFPEQYTLLYYDFRCLIDTYTDANKANLVNSGFY